jgi:hypothetical protein
VIKVGGKRNMASGSRCAVQYNPAWQTQASTTLSDKQQAGRSKTCRHHDSRSLTSCAVR